MAQYVLLGGFGLSPGYLKVVVLSSTTTMIRFDVFNVYQ